MLLSAISKYRSENLYYHDGPALAVNSTYKYEGGRGVKHQQARIGRWYVDTAGGEVENAMACQ